LEGGIADINVSVSAVKLLSLHTAEDQPKCVDVAWNVPENGETDVDQEVATASGDDGGRCGRKENGYENEADV